MTLEEMEIRIIRLEETIQALLSLSYKLDEMHEQGKQTIEQSEKLLQLLSEVQMDIAKMESKCEPAS